jgi:hypothetical protein
LWNLDVDPALLSQSKILTRRIVTNPIPTSLPALRSCLEQFHYPYAVQFRPITSDLQPRKMAYMDIAPDKESNGKTIVLFYGKEFDGYYFHSVIEALTGSGYRVVAPDQIGWGKSPKPDVRNTNPRVRWVLALVGVEELLTQSWPELRRGLARQGWHGEHSLLALTGT